MQWYYSKNGTQLGPVAQGELISKLASGEISPTDLVWKDGMGDWIPASQVAELRTSPAAGPVSTISPETPAAAPYAAPASPYASPVAGGEVISNWLWQSIVVTVLCCPICGIPGIVYAAKVDGLKLAGDIEGAKAAAGKAKMWTLIGVGGALVFWLLYITFAIIIGVGAAASAPTP